MSAAAKSAASALTTQPIERRERRPVSMSGYALREDGSHVEVLLLDLSYEGCGIEASEELRCGEPLKLSVLRRGVIDAEVRWCSGRRAGLIFTRDAEAADETRPKRCGERTPIIANVSLRRLGRAGFRVRVFDLSREGCRLELVERTAVGEHVMVKLDGIELLQAEVCWVTNHTAGVRFERPIHPAVFDLLLERLAQADTRARAR